MKPAVYICVFFMACLAWEGVLTICDTEVEKDLHRPLVKKKKRETFTKKGSPLKLFIKIDKKQN